MVRLNYEMVSLGGRPESSQFYGQALLLDSGVACLTGACLTGEQFLAEVCNRTVCTIVLA